jgi:Cu-processing system permease protein
MKSIWALALLVIQELYRRKDFYVLFVLTALLTLMMGAVNIFNEAHIVRYLKELCLLLIWVAALVIATTTAARQLPSERENRTIFPLLAKPVTRWQVIAGKFLGCWLAVGISLLVFYGFFAAVSMAREGIGGLPNYALAMVQHWAMLAVVISLALLGSVVLSTPAANVTLCLVIAGGILLLGRHLGKVARTLEEPAATLLYIVYFLIPHLEFFDLRALVIHNWGIALGPCFLAWGYAGAYTTFFLVLAWLVFRKQSL